MLYEAKGLQANHFGKIILIISLLHIIGSHKSYSKDLNTSWDQSEQHCSQDYSLVERWREHRHPQRKDRIKRVIPHVPGNIPGLNPCKPATSEEILLSHYLTGCHVICLQYSFFTNQLPSSSFIEALHHRELELISWETPGTIFSFYR